MAVKFLEDVGAKLINACLLYTSSALVEILGLHCECPIFGCLRFRRQCTNGKVSSSAKLVLKVPDECVKLTEYSVWADFMYHIQYTKPADYTMVAVDSVEQLSQAQLDKMLSLIHISSLLRVEHHLVPF